MSQVRQDDRHRARELVAWRRPGYGLEREFYVDPGLYRLEIDAIWRTGWIFVGHSCEASAPGDYFTSEIDGDEMVLVRQDDGRLAAFYNVCRHRGSTIVSDDRGHLNRLVCPYHQWVYGRDGALQLCNGAPEGFERASSGLHPIATAELGGLIFVSLDREALMTDEVRREIAGALEVQGLGQAKIAAQVDYEVPANWKLVWENNRECFHCSANHPQYVRANFDNLDSGDTRRVGELATALERGAVGLARSGLSSELFGDFGLTEFPDPTGRRWWSTNRTVLVDGFVTESLDGELVAPIMGEYADAEVGTLRIRTLPNFWCHASCDHVVTTRLLPNGPATTTIRVSWLVDAAAEDGSDYELAKLMPFWQLTSEQDWAICGRQQRGVSSTAYTPGPLSPVKEANVDRFLTWYTGAMIA